MIILIAERNFAMVLGLADYVHIIRNGEIVHECTAEELREKEETKKIPIIIVSGKGDMIVQIKKRIKDLTLDGGSIEYILKPFEAVELLAKIDIAINTQ